MRARSTLGLERVEVQRERSEPARPPRRRAAWSSDRLRPAAGGDVDDELRRRAAPSTSGANCAAASVTSTQPLGDGLAAHGLRGLEPPRGEPGSGPGRGSAPSASSAPTAASQRARERVVRQVERRRLVVGLEDRRAPPSCPRSATRRSTSQRGCAVRRASASTSASRVAPRERRRRVGERAQDGVGETRCLRPHAPHRLDALVDGGARPACARTAARRRRRAARRGPAARRAAGLAMKRSSASSSVPSDASVPYARRVARADVLGRERTRGEDARRAPAGRTPRARARGGRPRARRVARG